MPIDELEAFLPSLGVKLPSGSRLQGGTLTMNLNVSGSSSAPVINGPVRIENTQLAGFDLGSKLSAITSLTGAKTGSATVIRSLSMDLHSASGAIRTDNLNLVVPSLGTATGNGTVGAGGALDYHVVLKLAVLGGGASTPAPSSAGGIAGQLLGMIPGGGGGGFATRVYRIPGWRRTKERHPGCHRRHNHQSDLCSQHAGSTSHGWCGRR